MTPRAQSHMRPETPLTAEDEMGYLHKKQTPIPGLSSMGSSGDHRNNRRLGPPTPGMTVSRSISPPKRRGPPMPGMGGPGPLDTGRSRPSPGRMNMRTSPSPGRQPPSPGGQRLRRGPPSPGRFGSDHSNNISIGRNESLSQINSNISEFEHGNAERPQNKNNKSPLKNSEVTDQRQAEPTYYQEEMNDLSIGSPHSKKSEMAHQIQPEPTYYQEEMNDFSIGSLSLEEDDRDTNNGQERKEIKGQQIGLRNNRFDDTCSESTLDSRVKGGRTVSEIRAKFDPSVNGSTPSTVDTSTSEDLSAKVLKRRQRREALTKIRNHEKRRNEAKANAMLKIKPVSKKPKSRFLNWKDRTDLGKKAVNEVTLSNEKQDKDVTKPKAKSNISVRGISNQLERFKAVKRKQNKRREIQLQEANYHRNTTPDEFSIDATMDGKGRFEAYLRGHESTSDVDSISSDESEVFNESWDPPEARHEEGTPRTRRKSTSPTRRRVKENGQKNYEQKIKKLKSKKASKYERRSSSEDIFNETWSESAEDGRIHGKVQSHELDDLSEMEELLLEQGMQPIRYQNNETLSPPSNFNASRKRPSQPSSQGPLGELLSKSTIMVRISAPTVDGSLFKSHQSSSQYQW